MRSQSSVIARLLKLWTDPIFPQHPAAALDGSLTQLTRISSSWSPVPFAYHWNCWDPVSRKRLRMPSFAAPPYVAVAWSIGICCESTLAESLHHLTLEWNPHRARLLPAGHFRLWLRFEDGARAVPS